MREFRMELRRSSAPVAALGTVFLVLALVLSERPTWQDGWPDLSTSLRSFLILLIPVALAAGAWQGGRERRARTEELMATTSRPPWQRILPPTGALVAAVVVVVSIVLLVLVVVTGTGNWMHQAWPLAVALTGLLALAAATTVGAGLGRTIRSNLAAPLLMIATVFLLVKLYGRGETHWPSLLNPVLETRQNANDLLADTLQVRPAVTAGQSIWLLGLLLGGLLLAGAVNWRSRLIAGVPVLAGLVLAVPFLASSGGAVYGVDPTANRQFCAPGTPLVCGAIAHREAVLRAAVPARQVLAALAQLPQSPTRAVESSQFEGRPLPADVLPMSAFSLSLPSATSATTAAVLALGLGWSQGEAGVGERHGCEFAGNEVERYRDAQIFTGAWLLRRPTTGDYSAPDEPELDRSLAAFYALPRAEQIRRMTSARNAFRTCSPNILADLTAPATK